MTQVNRNCTGDQKSPVLFGTDMLDRLIHPACIMTSRGIIEYSNRAFNDMFRISGDENRFNWSIFFCSDGRRNLARDFTAAFDGAFTSTIAEMKLYDDSEKVPVEVLMQPLSGDGQISSVLVLVRHAGSEGLLDSFSADADAADNEMAYCFEFSPFPMMRLNKDLTISLLSRSFEGILGYTIEDISGDQFNSSSAIFKYDSEKIKNSLLELFRGNVPFKRFGEIKVRTKSGDEKIVNIQAYPVYHDNSIQYADVMMEDITKVRELKDRLSSTKRLNLVNDIGKGFIHSINNTINVILNQTQLLQIASEKTSVSEGLKQIERYVHDVVGQLRRIQGFLDDRGDGRDEKEEPLSVIINDALEFAKIHFKVDENRRKRSITLENEYEGTFNVRSDTLFIRELLIWAILKVSVYAGKNSSIQTGFVKGSLYYLTVTIDHADLSGSGNIIPFTIDSFSPSEIRNEAEKHNIRVIEEESSDQYSIRIVLPQKMIVEKAASLKEAYRNVITDRNIIIVEDEPVLQMILGNLFERMGNRVFITDNGTEGLEEFKRSNYDIVITDYDVAGITGLELAARVKEINEDTLTILLSGWGVSAFRDYKSFIDLFMAKPFNIDDLVRGMAAIDSLKSI